MRDRFGEASRSSGLPLSDAMPVTYDQRGWSSESAHSGQCLSDKFEVIKEIGDGSFGSVALARVRAGGAHIARRNTMVSMIVASNRATSLK